jgi:hypothetical protein
MQEMLEAEMTEIARDECPGRVETDQVDWALRPVPANKDFLAKSEPLPHAGEGLSLAFPTGG